MKNFADDVIDAIREKKSYLCVGLDPQLRYFPPHILKWAASNWKDPLQAVGEAIYEFNRSIIDVTYDFAMGFKPQMAFYEKYGYHGVRAFERTTSYIKTYGALCIEDAKREDGGDTAQAYADGHLGRIDVIRRDGKLVKIPSIYNADAITITPWIGSPNLIPFKEVAKKEGKGVFVVDKTSFKPEAQLQEIMTPEEIKAWVVLAGQVRELGEDVKGRYGYSSIGVVMGATYPEDAVVMQSVIPYAIKLKPGFGYQGSGADDAVIGVNDDGFGIIVNNSRATNYAYLEKFSPEFVCHSEKFAQAAARASRQGRDMLNDAVERRIGMLPF
jgi:orotidine-5'-phosphate decarboxylase